MLSGSTWCRFATTCWTLVGQVRGPHQEAEAMDLLTRIYYPAVYGYLRRSGIDAEKADEHTQSFFADVVVGRRLFEQFNANKGRARDYLLKALKNHQHDLHRREVARGKGRLLSEDALEREEVLIASQNGCDPAEAFERRAATATLEEAIRRCEAYCMSRGLSSNWAAYEARIAMPALHNVKPTPLAQLADDLNFRKPADVSAAVQTVERRTALLVREVLAETSPSADIDTEYQRFVSALTSID